MVTSADRPDIIFHLLRNSEKKGCSTIVVEAKASLIILARSETTVVVLTVATNYVLKNSRNQETPYDEVRDNLNKLVDVGLLAVSKLPYLAAVVQDALRVMLLLADGLPRIVSQGVALVNGPWVPKTVSLPQSFANRLCYFLRYCSSA